MTTETETDNKVWVPLEELEEYFRGISAALLSIVGNMEATMDKMKEEIKEQKGDTNDDN